MSTRQLEHINAGTPTGTWIRKKLRDSSTGLVVLDIDSTLYMMYDYKAKHFLLLEEKAYGDTIHTAQGLTLPILNKALAIGLKAMCIDYWGLWILRMQGGMPSTSEWMTINGKPVTEVQLIKLLNFECKP